MRIVTLAVGAAGLLAGTAALAQQPAPQAGTTGDVNTYLCTFAGKCDGTAGVAAEATPTLAAPPTKGFRLAAAAQAAPTAPTAPAPTTRGFRLATGRGTAQAAPAAPTTRGFRIATSRGTTPIVPPAQTGATANAFRVATPGTTGARQGGPRVGRGRNPGRSYAGPVARAPVVPGVPAAPRADLLLTFDLNSAQMTPGAEARARTFAQALMMDELRGKRFMIEGHTDARGSRTANIDLSRRRAQSVADFLIAQGVDRNRVEVRGVGPDAPLPGRPASSEDNRRVEAVLL